MATVIPAKLKGMPDAMRVLEQTPHSLFWDFDALGYIFMGLATFFAAQVFATRGFQKWVRIGCFANALVTPLIAFGYFYPVYSEDLLFIGFPWAITAPLAMLMIALFFKKELQQIKPVLIILWKVVSGCFSCFVFSYCPFCITWLGNRHLHSIALGVAGFASVVFQSMLRKLQPQ